MYTPPPNSPAWLPIIVFLPITIGYSLIKFFYIYRNPPFSLAMLFFIVLNLKSKFNELLYITPPFSA